MLCIDFIDSKIRLAKGLENLSFDIAAGNINPESEETTHFSVIDKDGNAVGALQSG